MSLAYYAGWDFSRIGSFSLVFTDGGGSHTATISTGTYAHVDMQTILGTANYDDFATILKTTMDAASGTNTFTVTFSTTTHFYTITPNSGTIVIGNTTNPVAKNMLGFNSLPTGAAASITSQIHPYYCIIPGVLGRSSVSDDYEAGEIAVDGEADDGNSYGVTRTQAPLYHDWTQALEAKELVYKRSAAAAVPWTFQHLFEHARNVEPLLIQDSEGSGTDDLLCRLTASGCVFAPSRATADYDGQWNVPFRTRLYQTTSGVSRQ